MRTRIIICICILSLLFSACGQDPGGPTAAAPEPTATITSTPRPTATALPSTEWIAPAIPDTLRKLGPAAGFSLIDDSRLATARLEIAQFIQVVEGHPIFSEGQSVWYYALVAPFATVTDGVSLDELKQAWAGTPPAAFANRPLLMTESTYAAMKSVLGVDAAAGATRLVPADRLVDALWQDKPQWGIVPFEALDPKLKVLEVDGQSPIRKAFNEETYPLKLTFVCLGVNCNTIEMPVTNRDPSKLTTLIMTGVTALVRATAYKMEVNGPLYPGRDIRETLREADITHISNEIPFAQDCPKPISNSKRLIFCSDPKYIDLLDDIGTDVVELTGNHMEDWNQQAMRFTLQTYKDHDMVVYGGGEDLAASQRAATIERNRTKFAFVGCNPVGPDFAWADVGWPGAAPCGDYQWMVDEIKRMKAQGYIVIASFQYYEYYSPEPRPRQREVFRMMAEAGADVVSGSQAHSAQAMEFDNGAFIHYGLGNLFFDQMNVTDYSRYEFLDRYVFYDGRMLSVDLVTAMLEDYSQPAPMGPAQRADFLTYIFQASGWLPKGPDTGPKPTPTLVPLP
jgi:Bacterial capsule synthesis protein PGA_cap